MKHQILTGYWRRVQHSQYISCFSDLQPKPGFSFMGHNPAHFRLILHIPPVPKYGFDSHGRPKEKFHFFGLKTRTIFHRENWLPAKEKNKKKLQGTRHFNRNPIE